MESSKSDLEVWGGVECTYNRVGDLYYDQLKYNGHDRRLEDLDRFAEIGLKALRYPFIWEKIAPEGVDSADWRWADERTARLRELGIRIIAGFVHHGSGPRNTSLLDPGFGEKLAGYAKAFAERYPWIEDYTPVNEQLTTARFSALYGVWYPHSKDGRKMLQALVNQCRGTILSMQAIRRVNPKARLIQTDDLGKISSTAALKYQADFENERRWLGFDLLCGRVVPSHPLYSLFTDNGFSKDELHWFVENSCPPDIIGINHYVLSNRHLDERLENYPAWSHGGNGRDGYADVETVRVDGLETTSPKTIYREAWERYKIPIAITEVHLDAAREDQVRWVMQVWKSAQELREEGVDVRAITYWGLLGHYDWHCLVSRCEGYYESGAFDLRAPEPRATLLVKVLRDLSFRGNFEHPLLSTPGWWRRPSRIRYPRQAIPVEPGDPGSYEIRVSRTAIQPLVITGKNGTLGKAYARICEARGIPYALLTRQEMDIADPASIQTALARLNPWAVINTAGYVRVDEAETDSLKCARENVEGPRYLASACAQRGIQFMTFSSDLVFDGLLQKPYTESMPVSPLNVYGRTKAEAEVWVQELHPEALVIRTSAFFGPWDEYNFVTSSLRKLAAGEPIETLGDVKISPTYVPDLVHTSLNLLLDRERGIWHLANSGEITWTDLAIEAAKLAKLDSGKIVSKRLSDLHLPARRAHYSVLGSERGILMPSLDKALNRYFEEAGSSLIA